MLWQVILRNGKQKRLWRFKIELTGETGEQIDICGSGPEAAGSRGYQGCVWVYVQCSKCGEKLALRLRKSSEIQREEAGSQGYQMFINKTIVGNRCFNRMQRLEFDGAYRVVNKQLESALSLLRKNTRTRPHRFIS